MYSYMELLSAGNAWNVFIMVKLYRKYYTCIGVHKMMNSGHKAMAKDLWLKPIVYTTPVNSRFC